MAKEKAGPDLSQTPHDALAQYAREADQRFKALESRLIALLKRVERFNQRSGHKI
jgi:hypothetical protein